MPENVSPILEYARMIQQDGINAPSVREYYREHENDPDFKRRAEVLHKLARAKSVPMGSVAAVH